MCVLKPKEKLKLNIGVLINGKFYFFNNFCLLLHLSSRKIISSIFKFFFICFSQENYNFLINKVKVLSEKI